MLEIKLGGGGRKQILCDYDGVFRKSSVVLSLTTQGNDDALRHVFYVRAADGRKLQDDMTEPVRAALESCISG